MFEKQFALEIITPTGIVFHGEATSITAPGVLGGFQVLHNHAPMLSALGIGEITVRDSQGQEASYAVTSGFLEVKKNSVVVLADAAEHASQINVDRANRARDRATERVHSKNPDVDLERAKLSMVRALNRLRVAAKV